MMKRSGHDHHRSVKVQDANLDRGSPAATDRPDRDWVVMVGRLGVGFAEEVDGGAGTMAGQKQRQICRRWMFGKPSDALPRF